MPRYLWTLIGLAAGFLLGLVIAGATAPHATERIKGLESDLAHASGLAREAGERVSALEDDLEAEKKAGADWRDLYYKSKASKAAAARGVGDPSWQLVATWDVGKIDAIRTPPFTVTGSAWRIRWDCKTERGGGRVVVWVPDLKPEIDAFDTDGVGVHPMAIGPGKYWVQATAVDGRITVEELR